MGEANEQLQETFSISRERQDEFAARSHRLADEAWTAGLYDDLVVPVPGVEVERDESIRPGTTTTRLAELKPSFRLGGTITAGNASPLSDGASAVLIGSEAAATRIGATPLARIAGRGFSALEPQRFGFAPVEAANQALGRAGIGWSDVSAVELNEAAATTPVAEPEPEPTPEPLPEPTPEPAPPIVLAPEPGTDTGQRRRRWPILVLAAAAVLLAFVVGLLLLDEPDETDEASSPPSTSPSQDRTSPRPQEPTEDPTTESSNPDPEQPTATDPVVAGDPAGFVEGSYAALPEDTETAWALLSPDLQAQVGSYEDYQGFWATIASVTVDDAVSSGQDAVDVTITYTSNDGRVEQEVRRLAVEPTDDAFLIVGDEVVG